MQCLQFQEELFHFESRLLKLSHLYAEHVVGNEKNKVNKSLDRMPKHFNGMNFDDFSIKKTKRRAKKWSTWRKISKNKPEKWKNSKKALKSKYIDTVSFKI